MYEYYKYVKNVTSFAVIESIKSKNIGETVFELFWPRVYLTRRDNDNNTQSTASYRKSGREYYGWYVKSVVGGSSLPRK